MLSSPHARQRMTQRAELQRSPQAQAGASTDRLGGAMPDRWQALGADVPCFYWSTKRTEYVQPARTVVVEDLRIMFPNSTDVTERDQVVRVKNRKGDVLVEGPFDLLGVRQKQGFIEAAMMLTKS